MFRKLSKIFLIIFPIKSYELNKFFSLAGLMFLILLNQNLIRNIKDTLIINLIGPQVISYIKLWFEMPIGVMFILVYGYLSNLFTNEQVFRIIVTFFLLFFMLFAFVLYPHSEILHPNEKLVEHYVVTLPYLKWFIIIWGKWCYVLFYIMGELWSIIIFTIFFWQLANKINTNNQAKRFYVILGVFGQSNLLISGSIITCLVNNYKLKSLLFSTLNNSTEIVIKLIILAVLLFGIMCLMLHRYIEKKNILIMKNTNNSHQKLIKTPLQQNIKILFKSKYLMSICLLMICYSGTINLIEGLWFSRTKALFPAFEDFSAYQGKILYYTGISTLIFALLGNIITAHCKWIKGAIITPLVVLIFGVIFFILTFIETSNIISPLSHNTNFLTIVVYAGGILNILTKGVKYSLFDATKEMVYIPLNKEMKTKGKAAVEVIGSKLGKSIGAIIQCITFTIFPMASHEDIVCFLFIMFLIFCVIWIYSVTILNTYYSNMLKNKVTTIV